MLAWPVVWVTLACVLCLNPLVTVLSPLGILRVPSADAACTVVHLATLTGVAWGVVLVASQRWALERMAHSQRIAIEWTLIVACGLLFGLLACTFPLVQSAVHASDLKLPVASTLWSECALALLLVQTRARGGAVVSALITLTWVGPAILSASAPKHHVLEAIYRSVQHLSAAGPCSDNATLTPLAFAPGAALILAAWLGSRPQRR